MTTGSYAPLDPVVIPMQLFVGRVRMHLDTSTEISMQLLVGRVRIHLNTSTEISMQLFIGRVKAQRDA
jgi:hypothetical protein